VGWVWGCYLLGVLPYTIKQVYVQGHLVLKNTKDLLKCAFWLIFLNILLNYILMKPFKTAGIAIATTLTSAFSLFYLSSRFYRRLDREEVKS
jgi:peptidoglycan biosynthesis protein MviN/MurJ (putative lipid II flippase)